jgi:hypothetical protein
MSREGNCYSHDWLRGLVVSLRQVYSREPAEYAERVRDKPVLGTVRQLLTWRLVL